MMRHHATHRVFTHADVNHVRIVLGYGNRANRPSLKISIRDISPTDPHVLGLPQPASGRPHVVSLGITHDTGPTIRPPTTKRTNRPPLKRLEDGVVIICRRLGRLRRKLNCKKRNEKKREKGL